MRGKQIRWLTWSWKASIDYNSNNNNNICTRFRTSTENLRLVSISTSLQRLYFILILCSEEKQKLLFNLIYKNRINTGHHWQIHTHSIILLTINVIKQFVNVWLWLIDATLFYHFNVTKYSIIVIFLSIWSMNVMKINHNSKLKKKKSKTESDWMVNKVFGWTWGGPT